MSVLDRASILAARDAIAPHVVATPLVWCEALGVHLKLELLQRTGSFKVRGAFHRLLHLTAGERAAGIVAVSAGNHAAAVALAGRELGVDVLVLMPKGASTAKVALTRSFGATVDLESDGAAVAFSRMAAISAATGRVIVHPYDDPLVIAGAASVGLEIAESAPDADVVVVPLGGGGLSSGIASALAAVGHPARVVAVDARATSSLAASLAAGAPVRGPGQPTFADALAAPIVGEHPLAIARALGILPISLDEDQLLDGFRAAYRLAKVACEVGGSAAVGALVAGLVRAERPVCVVSGGNIAADVAARYLQGSG